MAASNVASLHTDRLALRPFRSEDRDAFSCVLQDDRSMGSFGGVYDDDRVDQELAHYLGHRDRYGFAPFAVWLGDGLIGDIGPMRLEDGPDVEILYRLLPAHWRRGFATEACRASLGFAFSALGVSEVVAVIADGNVPSEQLARSLGFIKGEVGTYYGQQLVRHAVNPATFVSG